jgi:hypothetical protein
MPNVTYYVCSHYQQSKKHHQNAFDILTYHWSILLASSYGVPRYFRHARNYTAHRLPPRPPHYWCYFQLQKMPQCNFILASYWFLYYFDGTSLQHFCFIDVHEFLTDISSRAKCQFPIWKPLDTFCKHSLLSLLTYTSTLNCSLATLFS